MRWVMGKQIAVADADAVRWERRATTPQTMLCGEYPAEPSQRRKERRAARCRQHARGEAIRVGTGAH